MKVLKFDLNEEKTAYLVVTLAGVPGPFFRPSPALIHASAGGFQLCSESDTIGLGSRLIGKGFNVICSYMYPVGENYRFPQVVIDMMRAIRLVREHADEWGVEKDKIVISGNSAGAFICMATGNLWNRPEFMEKAGCAGEEGRPDAMVLGFGPMFCGQKSDDGLVYVPNGDLVGDQTPPAFFHHAREDRLVSVYQTLAMLEAFERRKRPYAVYISSVGDHGATGMPDRILHPDGKIGPCIDDWFEQCWRFLQNQLGISANAQPAKPMVPPKNPAPSPEGSLFAPLLPPENGKPVTPADLPLGGPDEIHMPFNAAFFDQDYTVFK
ncbi:MAG: alpha/beta hydrolase [Clostridia bacterium]|nr:alpha/beta hydrolase [Clostridia bacterium]